MQGNIIASGTALAVLAAAPVAAFPQAGDPGFEITPHHIGISVPDLEASVAWYQEMLGFEVLRLREREEEGQSSIALLRRGGAFIELFEIPGAAPLPEYRRDPSADLRVHGTAHFAYQVEDAMAALEILRSKDAEIVMGPVDNPGAIFFFVRDNSGNTFELIEYKNE